MFDARTVAAVLRSSKITVLEVNEPEYGTDGSITLENDISIQVGSSYLGVDRWCAWDETGPTTMQHYGLSDTFPKMMKILKKCMEEARVAKILMTN